MATLAFKSQPGIGSSPQTVEPDTRVQKNSDRDVLVKESNGLFRRWLGYRERGLVGVEYEEYDYLPIPPRRVVNVRARVIGRTIAEPLPSHLHEED